jgi:hypothetical protein
MAQKLDLLRLGDLMSRLAPLILAVAAIAGVHAVARRSAVELAVAVVALLGGLGLVERAARRPWRHGP